MTKGLDELLFRKQECEKELRDLICAIYDIIIEDTDMRQRYLSIDWRKINQDFNRNMR